MKRYLSQKLNTSDDSFNYTLLGEDQPIFKVDSSGYLTKFGIDYGHFKIRDNQWHLYLDDVLYMSGPPNGLFGLPEFELKALTALVNECST